MLIYSKTNPLKTSMAHFTAENTVKGSECGYLRQ